MPRPTTADRRGPGPNVRPVAPFPRGVRRAAGRGRAALVVAGALGAVAWAAACGGDAEGAATGPTDPGAAVVETSDVPRFWRAYDAGGSRGDAAAFQRVYLDSATPGLRDFIGRRAVTAASLAQIVTAAPRYFAAARGPLLALAAGPEVGTRTRAAYQRLRELYPDAAFPPITLLVGRFSTGGTTGPAGLLIGAEFYGAGADTPLDELGAFQRANVHGPSPDSLAFVVAHESVHVQQAGVGTARGDGATLLERAFMEGSADFVGELASGGTINARVYAWALPRERAVWADFKAAMAGRDVGRWLYNQGSPTSAADSAAGRPGDLGYFVGYRIAEAYYARQADKRAAVREIIRARDVAALLAASGYDP